MGSGCKVAHAHEEQGKDYICSSCCSQLGLLDVQLFTLAGCPHHPHSTLNMVLMSTMFSCHMKHSVLWTTWNISQALQSCTI